MPWLLSLHYVLSPAVQLGLKLSHAVFGKLLVQQMTGVKEAVKCDKPGKRETIQSVSFPSFKGQVPGQNTQQAGIVVWTILTELKVGKVVPTPSSIPELGTGPGEEGRPTGAWELTRRDRAPPLC